MSSILHLILQVWFPKIISRLFALQSIFKTNKRKRNETTPTRNIYKEGAKLKVLQVSESNIEHITSRVMTNVKWSHWHSSRMINRSETLIYYTFRSLSLETAAALYSLPLSTFIYISPINSTLLHLHALLLPIYQHLFPITSRFVSPLSPTAVCGGTYINCNHVKRKNWYQRFSVTGHVHLVSTELSFLWQMQFNFPILRFMTSCKIAVKKYFRTHDNRTQIQLRQCLIKRLHGNE